MPINMSKREKKIFNIVKRLYKELSVLIENYLKKSRKENKYLLLITANVHSEATAIGYLKNILIVNAILLDILEHKGIKQIYMEGSKRLADKWESLNCAKEDQIHECRIQHLARNYGLQEDHLEEGLQLNSLDKYKYSYQQREAAMIKHLLKIARSGVFVPGFMHIEPLSLSKSLREKFLIVPINAFTSTSPQPPLNFDNTEREHLGNEDYNKRFDFIFNSETTHQIYGVDNYQQLIRSDTALAMVKRASEQFHKNQAKLSKVNENKAPGEMDKKIAITAEIKASQVTLSHQGKEVLSPLKPGANHFLGSLGGFLANTTMPVKMALLPLSPTDFSPIQVNHLPEWLPFHQLLQWGFWGASKLGFCAKPAPQIEFDMTTPSYPQQSMAPLSTRSAAAEKLLQRQGSSLAAALIHCFGENYHNQSNRAQLKEFLINVINGDVNTVIGTEFNKQANSKDINFRVKKLTELAKINQEYNDEALAFISR